MLCACFATANLPISPLIELTLSSSPLLSSPLLFFYLTLYFRYEDGDEDMKAMLNKSWSESNEKKEGGGPPSARPWQ